MSFRAGPAQRDKIYHLVRSCELDPQTVTLLHKPAIENAGMRMEGWLGERLADFVQQLSALQASRFIDALQAQAGDA